MHRGLLISALLLISAELTGVFAIVEAAVDAEVCLDDGADCHCPPGCTCCCCSHVARILIAPPVPSALLSPSEESAALLVERAPPPTDPREILHVPKLGLLERIEL